MSGETTTDTTPTETLYGETPPEDKTQESTESKTDESSTSNENKTEDKPDGEKPEDESKDTEDKKSEENKEEEKTPLEIKLPEGVEVDQAVLDEFKSLAEQAGLNNEAVQPLLDLHFKQLEAQAKAYQEEVQAAWNTTIDGWKKSINEDPDLGGDKAEAVQATLAKALDEFGSAEAREAFDLTGAGWHPAIIKFVHNMAKALNEGTAVAPGRNAPAAPRSRAEALYGEQT